MHSLFSPIIERLRYLGSWYDLISVAYAQTSHRNPGIVVRFYRRCYRVIDLEREPFSLSGQVRVASLLIMDSQ